MKASGFHSIDGHAAWNTNTGGECRSTKCGAIGFHVWWCDVPAAFMDVRECGRGKYSLSISGKERIREMEIAIFALMIAIPTGIMFLTGSNKKRGCGGGCATCGNRRTCHRRKRG